MSQTIKLNVAMWGAVVAIVVSIGGALIGYGRLCQAVADNRSRAETNAEAIKAAETVVREDTRRLGDKIDNLAHEIMELAKER